MEREREATGEDAAWMRRAVELARSGVRDGAGGPFGAVVVRAGRVVGEGRNEVLARSDPTAHAEVLAIRAASAALGTHVLAGCELYTSCEPCPMCLAAALWARLDRVWYAGTRADAAAAGFDDADFYAELERPPQARALPLRPLLREAAGVAFREWLAKPDRVGY